MGNSGIGVSFTLIGLALSVGLLILILMRDRGRRKTSEADVEQQLALWVESQRKQGASNTEIAAQLDAKRAEIRQND